MNSKERVLTSLNLGKPDKVPFMELGIDYEVGQRVLKKDNYTPFEIAEVLKLDGIGTGCYPNLYAKKKEVNGRSYIVGGLIEKREDLDMIKLDNPHDSKPYENIKRYVELCGKDRAVFGATNIGLDPVLLGMGLENFAYALADDIKMVEEMLDIYTQWACGAVEELQNAGVDVVWFTDDIAFNTSLMFSPQFFKEIAMPRMKKVISKVKVPIIFHSDGNIVPVLEDLISLGINAVHPMDPCAVDIKDIKRDYGSKICLIGNIDLRKTLVTGTTKEVEEEVKDRINNIGYNGGYIISSANTITNYCKTENVLAMRDAIEKYGYI